MPKIFACQPLWAVFQKTSGSEKFMDKRGGEYHDIPWKSFCFTVPKNFVREPFSVSLIPVIEKFYTSEGYVTIFDFLSKIYCLTVPKKSQVNSSLLCFRKFPVAKNLWIRGGGGSIKIFRRKFFASQCL